MFRLNYLDHDPIAFVGGLWRATADLVRGCVVTMLYHSAQIFFKS